MIPAPGRTDVACLCAAWCRLCDAYAEVLAQVADDPVLTPLAVRWHWVDIEDEADLIGDLDIETFPTLVIAVDGRARFAGPLTPQPETLRRLLVSTLIEATSSRDVADPDVQTLAGHLPGRPSGRRTR